MFILYPYVKRLFCFLLFLSGSLVMGSCSNLLSVISNLLLPGVGEGLACSNLLLVISNLLLPGAAEAAAAAAAAGVFGVLNAGKCDENALAKSDEARSDESSCCFCRLAPTGAEILFTCHGQADQIRIRISCVRLIGDQIAQEISKYFPTPNMLNQSQLRMLNLQVSLIKTFY